MGDPGQARQQPAPQTPARNKNRGPRSLWIDRWDNSFGFTLRHFIVYPPESYKLLARDKRFGLSQGGSSSLDEAMDTMFVRAVQRGSSAEAAGLVVGDRIVSINGSTIAGKTYAEVVQQIQKTPDRLHLLVVPGEEDIIQQYYRDTAHNPKTNVRPRLKSPEVASDQRRAVAVSTPQRTAVSPKIARTTIMQQQLHPIPVLQPGVPYIDNEPIYNQLTWPDQKIGSENRGTMERLHVKTHLSRRSSEGSSSKQSQAEQLSVIKSASPNPSAYYPNASGCRLSLDGGFLDRRESSSSSTLTDDSVIISRIRKSCEQKEEFLRNTVKPSYPHIIAREFYARPQKLQKPVWPPQSPEPEDGRTKPEDKAKHTPRTLTRIQETQSYVSGSLETDLDELTMSQDSPVSRSQSEESDSVRRGVTQPKLHIVSRRAKQFETGQLEEEDRTHFYRSELSRLSGKRNVPNVAVRKQEFEQRVVREEKTTQRPLEACPSVLSGNRTVIVGSKCLHAEPPTDFRQLEPEVALEDITPRARPRSNSADSWTSKDGEHAKRSLHGVSIDRARDEEKQRHKAVRQDSYLAAVKTVPGNNARPRRIVKRQISLRDSDESSGEEIVCGRHSLPLREVYRRPNRLFFPHVDNNYKVPANTVPNAEVTRRPRKTAADDERSTRRVSYLKATSSDQMNIDVDAEPTIVPQKSHRKWMYPMLPGEIQRLRRIFEEYSGILEPSGGDHGRRNIIETSRPDEKENLKVIKDGWLNCKVALIDGKRAGDRSWKQTWAILRGSFFSMQKDKQAEQPEHTLDIRSCSVDVPLDYTKRKNVLRLKTETETEYLLQAEDSAEMESWKMVLEEQSETSGNLLPQSPQKGNKKLSNLRTRSPTGQSPASKNRKPSQQDQIPSPKSKTWKGKLGKQFRKMQQSGGGSPSSPTITYPEGATIKVPLELCPPSALSEFIPLIVERCTAIVEARGLDIVGIYRVPGNTAAVTALTEAVNKGIELMNPEDPRWNDVNVISSLLKSFFRNLPDCLFTAELYPKFIAADKIADPKFRMVTLRKLLNDLPDHNYETLRHMLFHLKKIVSNSSVNKMETRNLAIVFGPTLLYTGDLVALVTDTSHQCRIVESLISHVDWFFSTDDVETLDNLVLPMSTESQSTDNQSNANLLLGNIRKVEGYCRGDHSPNKDMSPKDIVSSIISAANRKMSKGKSKKLDKSLSNCDTDNKTSLKKTDAKMEQSTSVAASIVSSFVGEIVRADSDDLDGAINHDDVMRSCSNSWGERIRRFEQETHAMLSRDPVRMRRDAERWFADKHKTDAKSNHDFGNPSDLSNNSNMTQISSQSEEGNPIRRGMSYESLHETTPNGSLKRFRSGREDGSLRPASSLDSLHGKPKSEASDDGNDLVISITKTFDEKLKSYLNDSDGSSMGDESKNTTEKAEYENVIEKESKLMKKLERKTVDEGEDNSEEKKDDDEDGRRSKVKTDAKIREKLMRFEVIETILRTKNAENASNLKRSESLTKPEKPETYTKLRRSESLNKSEKSSEFAKLKRSDSSKNDLKRSDSLTKTEKTETNINKRKQQEAGLKRSSSKEKENIMFVKMKRKNGMPDRSIKRRHTVGGTKDFDKLPWLDNRLQTEALEREETKSGKEKRNFRTSSPDLSSSRLQATIESEGLSIEVSLLGSRGNVLATLRKPLIPPLPTGRPQSMPPVSQIFKLPLESHV